MGSIQYNWDQLIKEIKKIRSEHDRAVKSKYQGRPLVLTQKQYFENNKIITRGLARWECIRRNEQFRQFKLIEIRRGDLLLIYLLKHTEILI